MSDLDAVSKQELLRHIDDLMEIIDQRGDEIDSIRDELVELRMQERDARTLEYNYRKLADQRGERMKLMHDYFKNNICHVYGNFKIDHPEIADWFTESGEAK